MAKIAIVDDNKEQRESLRISLSLLLEEHNSSLEVIDTFPFESFEEYHSWIVDEDISLLIFDERLHDQKEDNKGPVNYKGHELVKKIRLPFKDIPIFTVTAFVEDEDLQTNSGEFENVILRTDFNENGSKYVERIIRASQRYLSQNTHELSEFDDLTKKIAMGKGDKGDIEKLKALQIKLLLPYIDLTDREGWITEYEKQIGELEKLKITLERIVKK